MRLRSVRPLPPQLEGVDVSHIRFGASYDLGLPLYDLLLATGYGVPEDRLPDSKPVATKSTKRRRRAR